MEKKDNFIKRYNYVKDDIIKRLDEALIKAIGNEVIEFDKLEDNYLLCGLFKIGIDKGIYNFIVPSLYYFVL